MGIQAIDSRKTVYLFLGYLTAAESKTELKKYYDAGWLKQLNTV